MRTKNCYQNSIQHRYLQCYIGTFSLHCQTKRLRHHFDFIICWLCPFCYFGCVDWNFVSVIIWVIYLWIDVIGYTFLATWKVQLNECVCMYVYMYVCMYVWMNVHIKYLIWCAVCNHSDMVYFQMTMNVSRLVGHHANRSVTILEGVINVVAELGLN